MPGRLLDRLAGRQRRASHPDAPVPAVAREVPVAAVTDVLHRARPAPSRGEVRTSRCWGGEDGR